MIRLFTSVVIIFFFTSNTSGQWTPIPALNNEKASFIISNDEEFVFSFDRTHFGFVKRGSNQFIDFFPISPNQASTKEFDVYKGKDHFLFLSKDSLYFYSSENGLIHRAQNVHKRSNYTFHQKLGWLHFDDNGNFLNTLDFANTWDTIMPIRDVPYPSHVSAETIHLDMNENTFIQYNTLTGHVLYILNSINEYEEIYSSSESMDQATLMPNGEVITVFRNGHSWELSKITSNRKKHEPYILLKEDGERLHADGILRVDTNAIHVTHNHWIWTCSPNGLNCKKVNIGVFPPNTYMQFRHYFGDHAAHILNKEYCLRDSFDYLHVDPLSLQVTSEHLPNKAYGSRMKASSVMGYELAWLQNGGRYLYVNKSYTYNPSTECGSNISFEFKNKFFEIIDEKLFCSKNSEEWNIVDSNYNWDESSIYRYPLQDQWIIIKLRNTKFLYSENGIDWVEINRPPVVPQITSSHIFEKGHWIQKFGMENFTNFWHITTNHGATFQSIDLPNNTRFSQGDSIVFAISAIKDSFYLTSVSEKGILSDTTSIHRFCTDIFNFTAMDDSQILFWNEDSVNIFDIKTRKYKSFMDSLPLGLKIISLEKSLTNKLYLNSSHGIYTYLTSMDSITTGDSNQLKIFPNPSMAKFNVSIPVEYQSSRITFHIINSQGGVLFSTEAINKKIIEVKQLQPGIYYAMLYNENGILRSGKYIQH